MLLAYPVTLRQHSVNETAQVSTRRLHLCRTTAWPDRILQVRYRKHSNTTPQFHH